MDKGVFTHTHTDTHSGILLNQKKKELNFAICNDMHEPIKFIIGMEGMMLSEIARERQVLYVINYMGSLKNKTAQYNKTETRSQI